MVAHYPNGRQQVNRDQATIAYFDTTPNSINQAKAPCKPLSLKDHSACSRDMSTSNLRIRLVGNPAG
jgi:hypothetical protein